jgi:catechol-2,3-dioxygenase
MVAPAKFCHVVYRTHQFKTMVDWYRNVLEARIQHQGEKIAFMTYDDEHHRVAIVDIGPKPAGAPAPVKGGQGVAHVAFAWRNIDELIDTYKRLKRGGILPVRPIRHGLTLSLYYDDPDGNNLEFQIDTLDDRLANDFMASKAFAANPIGELFDPEALVARYEAGRPLDDLIFRSDQPEASRQMFVRGGAAALPLRSRV